MSKFQGNTLVLIYYCYSYISSFGYRWNVGNGKKSSVLGGYPDFAMYML
jgi:hypothetical protein